MTHSFINKKYADEIYDALMKNDRELFRNNFLKLHKNGQHEVFMALSASERKKVTDMITPQEFSQIFDMMTVSEQQQIFKELPQEFVYQALAFVSDDNVVDFLQAYDEKTRQKILLRMKVKDREPLKELLAHGKNTAGAMMTTEYISVLSTDSVDDVLAYTRKIGRSAEMIYYIYVTRPDGHLEGVTSLRDLILANEGAVMADVMNSQVVSVYPETNQRMVTNLIREYDLLAIPVTDSDEHLVGIVTVDDILDVMNIEKNDDFRRFSGIIMPEDEEEDTTDETVWMMTKSRLPWIIILLFLGLISANIIDQFEEVISQVVALAAFMPIIMDTAGNVGTQSLAVSIRRLTTTTPAHDSFIKTLLKEFASGFLMGIASAVTMFGISYVLYQNMTLSLIVSISLWVTLSVSTVIGYLVPAIFDKLNIDPAVASGPFITTINDTFGLLIYFGMASMLLHLI